ncbi:TPR repeat family protein [Synechococcus sp. ROS8604]|nr:TPR repeat family protein [Synechococcus sp. ROS8604]
MESGNYKEALNDINKAIRLDPNDYTSYHIRRGIIHIDSGNYKEALNDLNEAIRINPSFSARYETHPFF